MFTADMRYMQADAWCLHPVLEMLYLLPYNVCSKSRISHGGRPASFVVNFYGNFVCIPVFNQFIFCKS
jgi:hypothetical protein